MDNPMDVAQLDAIVHMASYLPFDVIDIQGWLAQDASIMSSIRWADIAKHVLEASRREMGVMHMQFWEVTLKCNALRGELVACQAK
ncbi:unnamed protein product [Sphagnum jensenii]|uniref:Uncharacterized protein n=1 Tax=Sphagnum jensenii TaxID=128206 RepID=A0ABP1AU84_9BRYO